MTREISAYILLAALFIGSLFNVSYLDRSLSSLEGKADEAFAYAKDGDFEAAEKLMNSICNEWIGLDSYTHVFLKHTEIDGTTDAFFELLSDISEENVDAAKGSLRKLKAHLDSLVSAERLSFGSIF